ncbi:unnamed protein product [Colias eurytheme]|nr:unnamed protein product [Colias eurytheme]
MDIEKLIETVRKYECLYDLSHRKYMDTKYKNVIWEKVGAEVGSSGAICKTRWANIRDTYRKTLKKSTTTSGQSAKKIKVYKFHDQLQFLKPFLNERQTIETIETDISEECDNELLGDQESTEIMEPRATTSRSTSLPSPESSQSASSVHLQPPKKARRTFSKSCSQPTAAAVVMEQLIKSNNSIEESFKNPVDAFLLGAIAPILKSLPRYELALAKSELFGIAQKYELQSITVPTVQTSADSRSSTTGSIIIENTRFTNTAIENPRTEDQESTY